MPKAPATPQVPGETAKPETVADAPVDQPAKDTVAVPKAQLAALMARLDALENQAKAKQETAKRANPDANLPDQDSIDLATLKSPVLTKQGWLVPEQYGAHPNAPKL